MKTWKVISVINLTITTEERGKARVETIAADNIDELLKAWRIGVAEDGFKESEVDLISITAV